MSIKKALFSTRSLTQGGIIAALYAALIFVNPLYSHGILQVRVSEALTILPLFTPVAIPGLFVGVLVANLFNPAGAHIIDIIFGSLATLSAASLTYWLGRKMLILEMKNSAKEMVAFLIAMIPPIILNAIVVGGYLYILFYRQEYTAIAAMSLVGLGQVIACYVLGSILYIALRKVNKKSSLL